MRGCRRPLAVLLATAFVMATVVPVYFVWITPELLQLQPHRPGVHVLVVQGGGRAVDRCREEPAGCCRHRPTSPRRSCSVSRRSRSRRTCCCTSRSRSGTCGSGGGRVCLVDGSRASALVTAGLFGANLAISGDWNYQGGERSTFYAAFPFQTPNTGYDVGAPRARDEALTDILFDPHVFWINLSHNLVYYFVGRYSGLVAYFFPAVFGLASFLWRPKRPGWQYPRAGRLSAPDRVFRHHSAVHVVRRRRLRRQSLLRGRVRRVPVPVAAD